MPGSGSSRDWSLLSVYGQVLVEIARDPGVRVRDIASVAGITERTAHSVIAGLVAAGYVSRTRVGRRNQYTVDYNAPFRPASWGERTVGPFVELLARPASSGGGQSPQAGEPTMEAQLVDLP